MTLPPDDGPIILSSMLGPWQQYDPGSVQWAKAIALHFQSNYWHIQRDGNVAPLVRIIRTALEAETPPWTVWPEEVNGNPKRWVKRITGDDWDTVGTLLRHGDPEAWNEISGAIAQWEAEKRTWKAQPRESGRFAGASDTGDGRDDESAQGIRRRLYKRANEGDSEAAALIRQLGTGEITVNQAAIAAGMRAKYLRVPDDEPSKVAESLVRRKGADWAVQLIAALAECLVDDPELQVRLAAADAGLVDTAHANALARSEREEDRIVAAFCSTLHPDLRDQLVKDSEKAVRLALVICEGTSNVQLLQLLSDVDPEIREKAMQRLSDRVAAELLTE